MHRRTPTWFLDSLVTILKFPIFEREALNFPFTLDHVNYVASPVKGYSYAGTRSKPWGSNQLEDHCYRDPIREHILPTARAVSLMWELRGILGNSQRMNFYPVKRTIGEIFIRDGVSKELTDTFKTKRVSFEDPKVWRTPVTDQNLFCPTSPSSPGLLQPRKNQKTASWPQE